MSCPGASGRKLAQRAAPKFHHDVQDISIRNGSKWNRLEHFLVLLLTPFCTDENVIDYVLVGNLPEGYTEVAPWRTSVEMEANKTG
jgi:hypothetical protein